MNKRVPQADWQTVRKTKGTWMITRKGGGENEKGQPGGAQDRRAGHPENGQASGGGCRGVP